MQGLGAGGLFTLVLAIIGDIVSPRERAKYTGYFMSVFATSSVLGPVAGGLFAGQDSILGITGWRWVFLVNVPIGIAALFVVNRNLHLHHVRREARIDWWGAVSLVVALVPLLTVAEQGRVWGWDSPRSLACYAIGAIGVAAFVFAEHRMGDDALIPLRIFRMRTVAVVIGASVIVGAAMFGAITVLPQYMQIVHGASPTKAGLMMLPMVVGMMSAGIGVGQITSRTGKIRIFPIFGSAPRRRRDDRAVVRRRRHQPALGDGRHALPRSRHRPVHAAADDHRAERRTPERDRRRHQLRDLLPPARRHHRRRGLPVAAVQHPRRQHQERLQERRPRASSRPPRRARSRTPRSTTRCSPGCRTPAQGGGVFASVQDDSSIIGRMSSCSRTPSRSASPTR